MPPSSYFRPALLVVSGIITFPLLLIIQGNDFTDMGFNLSNQWLIWRDANSYQHGYLLYLSNLIGGLWLSITMPLGLFAIKLGWVLVLYLTALSSYRTLKHSGRSNDLMVGLLFALVWSTKLGTTWMSYNEFSALAFVGAALLLVDGLTRDKRWFTAAAGAVVGASVFLRFPNVLYLGILLGIPFFARASRQTVTWMVRQLLLFVAGFAVTVTFVLVFMWSMDHLGPYWDQLTRTLSSTSNDPSNPYYGGNLMQLLIADYQLLAMSTFLSVLFLLLTTWALTRKWYWQLACLAVSLTLAYLSTPSGLDATYWYAAGALAILACGISWSLTRNRSPEDRFRAILFAIGILLASLIFLNYFQTYSVWLLPGLLYVAMGYCMWSSESPGEKLIAAVALLVLAVTPLGSGNGMINAVFGVWLAIPLSVVLLFDRIRALADVPFYQQPPLVLVVVILGAVAVDGLSTANVSTYRDSANRSLMTTSIDLPFFRGTLTTKDRAIVVEELMEELPQYISPGDPLLMHGGCALVYLLTDTRPVLGTVWDGAYTPQFYETKLRQLDDSVTKWPIVLLSKGSCRDRDWPISLRVTRNESANRQILFEFMRKRRFRLVWENQYFEIWQSGTSVALRSTN